VEKGDFDKVEKIVKKEIKALRRLKALPGNREKLDSLENWFNAQTCVKRAYWDKNTAYTLITLTFTRTMGVEYVVKDSVVEKCYRIRTEKQRYGDQLYWEMGWDIPDNRLTFLGSSECSGFIQQGLDIDSLNAKSRRLQRHNSAIRMDLQLVNYKQGNRYWYRPIQEGNPIYAMFTLRNVSGKKKRLIWPKLQNTGKKAVYFKLLNKRGKVLYTEDRNLMLPHNETIPFDVLTLDSGEVKVFYHMIDGCKPGLTPVECAHSLGVLQEGEYRLQAFYNPYIFDFPEDENLWLPKGKEELNIGGSSNLKVIRSDSYQHQLRQMNYKKENTNYDLAQVVCRVKMLGGAANYAHKNGTNHYDGFGVVEDSLKGGVAVGDTIAFSFRYGLNDKQSLQNLIREELIKSEIKVGLEGSYWIYATASTGSYYQILAADSSNKLEGKRNYQLINYAGAIQKVEEHQPMVSDHEK
jgi:hypothetical protein